MAVKDTVASFELALNNLIYERFNQFIPLAITTAVDTASGWGVREGGMAWSTYKATCRRNGVYKGTRGLRDMNAELFEPISRHLASGWERAFQGRLPAILMEFANLCSGRLQTFHESALIRARGRETNASILAMLANQIVAQSRTLTDMPNIIKAIVNDLQREANRQFTPVICEAMTDAYVACVLECGKLPLPSLTQLVVSVDC